MIRRRILSAFLSLALVAAPMAMGAVSASADGAIYDSITVVSGHRYYVKSVTTGEYLQMDGSARMASSRHYATEFRMDFTDGKGYQMVTSGGYVLTAASMTQGAALSLEYNTHSDYQYWSTTAFNAHQMLMAYAQYGMNIVPPTQAGGDVTLNNLYQNERFAEWKFEEVPTADTLELGVYTIRNTSNGYSLNLDTDPTGILLLNDSRPEKATKWVVQENTDYTYSMHVYQGGGLGTFTLEYPDARPTMVTSQDKPSGHNRIVAMGNNTYRIITSGTSLAALGARTDSAGKLYPAAVFDRDTTSWEFTYLGHPNDSL